MSRPDVGGATIRNVPASYATPQLAVAAAADGDTVLIAPGTYLGGIYVQNKALVVASWYLTTGDTTYIAQTVLDTVMTNPCPGGGCAGDAVIEFDHANKASKVVGLTIRRGKDGVRTTSQSGGVPNRVDIEWCHLFLNEDGADIQNGGRGTIRNNVFAYSTDDGLDLNYGVDLTIMDNMITENADDGIEFRLYNYNGAAVLTVNILNNKFIHNDSDGIQLIDDVDTISTKRYINIRNNLFVNNRKATVGCMPNLNTSEDYSGAPAVEKIHFINNTVVGDGYGVCGGANLVAINNVMKDILNIAFKNVIAPNSIVSHNLAYNCGTATSNCNVEAGTLLTSNPLLAPDYHLTGGSPAVNAGVASYIWRGVDVVGIPPSGYSGAAPDLGAYEYNGNAPVAVDDSYLVPKGTQIDPAAPGVLGNDIDPNSDPLTTNGVISGPYHGSLTLNSDGSFQYTHNNDSAPRDSFVYEVKDPALNTARATCVLLVQQPNAAPVAEFDAFLVDVNTTANGLDVLANDTDSDPGDVVTIHSLNTAGTLGTVTLQGDLVLYTPPAGFTGFDYFQYKARDLQNAQSAFVTVNVRTEDVAVVHVTSKVGAGSDDAEEVVSSGAMDLNSSDLEMTLDSPGEQKIGLRFPALAVPRNAQIRKAWIQFKTDETPTNATSLLLRSQAADNVTAFTSTAFNISSRPLGLRSVAWSPPIWTVVDEAGPNQATPNLTRVINEVVTRAGWNSGQALGIVVSGTGKRVARAYEIDNAGAAMLHVEYVNDVLPLGVDDEPALAFTLHGVRPSPARGPLTVDFSLARSERTSVELLDVAGRRVIYRDLGLPAPGRHRVELRDRLPAGLYLVRVANGAAVRTAKAVVLP